MSYRGRQGLFFPLFLLLSKEVDNIWSSWFLEYALKRSTWLLEAPRNLINHNSDPKLRSGWVEHDTLISEYKSQNILEQPKVTALCTLNTGATKFLLITYNKHTLTDWNWIQGFEKSVTFVYMQRQQIY